MPERPPHYARFPIEPLTFCMVNNLPGWATLVTKYICRAPWKGDEVGDIQKAIRCCEMRLEQIRREKAGEKDIIWKPF